MLTITRFDTTPPQIIGTQVIEWVSSWSFVSTRGWLSQHQRWTARRQLYTVPAQRHHDNHQI